MAAPGSSRLVALDLLRGLAVLVMIQTHALVLLAPGARAGLLFSWVVRLDGLVAPAFLLAAGFSLALVQVDASGPWRRAAGRSALRILEVLLAASLVNAAWFPIAQAPRYLLRIDILHCVGLSLALLLPLAVAARHRPAVLRWASLALGVALLAVAPLAEGVTGPWSLVLDNRPGFLDAGVGAVFPLLPWAGYVFLGASLGSFGASADAAPARRAWQLWLAALGFAAWCFQDQLALVYPPHQFWVTNPANAAQRVVLVLLGLGGLERLQARLPARWTHALSWLSAASLPVYVFHQLLLFEGHVGVFARLFRDRAGAGLYLVLLAALIAATVACTLAWRGLVQRLTSAARPRSASSPTRSWAPRPTAGAPPPSHPG
jgi:uncharacterized membrane protein